MHLQEDHFLMEIIDPGTGQVLPTGELGELVITHAQQGGFSGHSLSHRNLCRMIPGMRLRQDITQDQPHPGTLRQRGDHQGRQHHSRAGRGYSGTDRRRTAHLPVGCHPYDHHDELEIWIEISPKLFFDKMARAAQPGDAIRHKVANFIGITRASNWWKETHWNGRVAW